HYFYSVPIVGGPELVGFSHIKMSPDDKILVAIGNANLDYEVLVFVNRGDYFEHVNTDFGTESNARSAAFSPDGKYLVLGLLNSAPHGLLVFEVQGESFSLVSEAPGTTTNSAMAFRPDGKHLACSGMQIFHFNSGTLTPLNPPAPTV